MISEKTKQRKAKEIRAVLAQLGVTEESEAMDHMICAIRVAHEDAFLIRDVYGMFFPALVKELNGVPLERLKQNLCIIRDKQWLEGDRAALCKMANFEFQIKPSTCELIEVIRKYMEEKGLLQVLYL